MVKKVQQLLCGITIQLAQKMSGLLFPPSQRGSGNLKELAEETSTTTATVAMMQPGLVSDVDAVDGYVLDEGVLDVDVLAVDVGYRWELGERCCQLRFSTLVLMLPTKVFNPGSLS